MIQKQVKYVWKWPATGIVTEVRMKFTFKNIFKPSFKMFLNGDQYVDEIKIWKM